MYGLGTVRPFASLVKTLSLWSHTTWGFSTDSASPLSSCRKSRGTIFAWYSGGLYPWRRRSGAERVAVSPTNGATRRQRRRRLGTYLRAHLRRRPAVGGVQFVVEFVEFGLGGGGH